MISPAEHPLAGSLPGSTTPPLDRHDRGPPKDMGPWLGWTEARISELRRLREVLGLSLGQIVKLWACEGGGPSRNAIIGACYRQGIVGAPQVQLKPDKPRARKPWRSEPDLESSQRSPEPKFRERPLPKLRTIKSPNPPKLLADLEDADCRYPVDGEGAETLFCAAPRTQHRFYCEAHRAIAYQPAPILSEQEILQMTAAGPRTRWAA